ncbi:MAG: DUF5675 family protein [Bacteroidia bacterium]
MLQAIINFFKNLFSDQRPEYIPPVRTEPIAMPHTEEPEVEVLTEPELLPPPKTEVEIPTQPEPIFPPKIEAPEVVVETPTQPEPIFPPKIEVPEVVVETPTQPETIAVSETVVPSPQPEPLGQAHTETPKVEENTEGWVKLLLKRYSHGEKDTLGKLSINGEEICFTLEDKENYSREKVMYAQKRAAGEEIPDKLAYTAMLDGDTRIPAGEYEMELRTLGGLHTTYEIRYPDLHKGMLYLKNVTGFSYIYIHQGNSNADTKGCILLGESVEKEGDTSAERRLTNSKEAYLRVYAQVAEALAKGQKVTISIVNG